MSSRLPAPKNAGGAIESARACGDQAPADAAQITANSANATIARHARLSCRRRASSWRFAGSPRAECLSATVRFPASRLRSDTRDSLAKRPPDAHHRRHERARRARPERHRRRRAAQRRRPDRARPPRAQPVHHQRAVCDGAGDANDGCRRHASTRPSARNMRRTRAGDTPTARSKPTFASALLDVSRKNSTASSSADATRKKLKYDEVLAEIGGASRRSRGSRRARPHRSARARQGRAARGALPRSDRAPRRSVRRRAATGASTCDRRTAMPRAAGRPRAE